MTQDLSTEVARPGRRAAALRTRTRMLDAARELADLGGFDRTTVAQVTDRAGTSRATFYLYFENIREIYLELARRTSDQLFEAAAQGWHATDLETSVASWVRGYVTCFRENAGILRVSYGHRFDDADFNALIIETRLRLTQQLATGLDGCMAVGLARPMDTRLTAEALGSMLESLCVFEIDHRQQRDLTSLCEGLADLWLHAVGRPLASLDS